MTVRPGNPIADHSGARSGGAPQVNCDLCEAPMPVPDHCIHSGHIVGLLVCTQCIEDQLEASCASH